MKTNLRARIVVIAVTILICVYGIINVPKSKAELVQNVKNNIRLGLDLKGGSHLVLEVQVQDAVKADAEQVLERMKEELKKQNISYTSMEVTNLPDNSTPADADNITITIKGVPPPDQRVSQPGDRSLFHLYFDLAQFHRLHA